VTTDPSRIGAKAAQARELFATNGLHTTDNPRSMSPETGDEPCDSTETTTIYYETAGMTRAVELSRQASANLKFLKDRDLLKPRYAKAAEKSLVDLDRFLGQNRAGILETIGHNKKVLEGKLRRNEQKLASLASSLEGAKGAEGRSALMGKINLANLNRRRLQKMAADNQRIAGYLRGVRAGPTETVQRARKSEG